MKNILFLCVCFCSFFGVKAQFITHGPVVGAVTPNSAKMYLRTNNIATVIVELSKDSLFSNTTSITDTTRAWRDTTAMISLNNLESFTEYYYRFIVNGNADTLKGHFRTAPVEGEKNHYTFLLGSCSEYDIPKPYNAAIANKPHLLLHNGDLTYPDYQLPWDYRLNMNTIAQSYRHRYGYSSIKKMLRHMAMDYVYDNHDGAGARDNVSITYSYIDSVDSVVVNVVEFQPVPPGALENCLQGYRLYSPHYPLADSSIGLYHSFKYGNAEIFFVDVRNCGTQVDSCFSYNAATNNWTFNPDKLGHSLIGAPQMQWLKQGLSNSNADWKLIVSGVMFNQKFRKIINIGMALQWLRLNIGGLEETGFKLAHAFAYNWAGFPRESNELLNHISTNNIKDVVMLTGHVHTNVMDDGRNAGLPELNTGPMSGYGAELTYYLDSLMQVLNIGNVKDSLWNAGGQGVFNTNFKSGFGRVDVHGNDSLVMRLIDEDNLEVAKMVLPHSSKVSSVFNKKEMPLCVIQKVFPNPTKDNFKIQLCADYTRNAKLEKYYLIDMQGKLYFIKPEWKNNYYHVSTKDYPAGNYLLVFDYGDDVATQHIVIGK